MATPIGQHGAGRRDDPARRSRSPSTSSPWRCATPIQDHLLDGNSTLYWIGVAAIPAYGASYFARGFLAGSHRLTIYALLIISESVSRTAFPFAVALGIASGQTAVAIGIVAAPTLSLIVVPFAFLRRFGSARRTGAPRTPRRREVAGSRPDRRVHARTRRTASRRRLPDHAQRADLPQRRAAARQREPPGAAAAGYIFNVLMIARAPLQLFQAVSTSLLPHLTTLRLTRDNEERLPRLDPGHDPGDRRLRGAGRPRHAIAGPHADADRLRQEVHLRPGRPGDRHASAWASTSSAVTLNQAALAQGRCGAPRCCWIGCAIVFVDLDAACRSSATSSTGSRSATSARPRCSARCSTGSTASRCERTERPIEPGSAEEMELQLASADEAG